MKKIFAELDEFLKRNPDERLYIRIVMYKTIAAFEYYKELNEEEWKELQDAMRRVVLLDDEQLISELYSLYSEQFSENVEDIIFYLSKAAEIMQKIGADHFPLVYQRFWYLSYCFFSLQEYDEAIEYAKKGLNLMVKDQHLEFHNFCLMNDIIGASYYELGDAENTIRYYQNILDKLPEYLSYYGKYYDIYKAYEKEFAKIWSAVAKGGIAKGYFLQRKYDEATLLLEDNIRISLQTKQLNDVSKAQNILAQIHVEKGNHHKALQLWKASNYRAAASKAEKYFIQSLQGIAKSFAALGQYDSAYHYNNKYYIAQQELFNRINHSKLKSITARIEYEKLRVELAEANTDVHYQKNIRNLIAGTALVLLLLFFLVYIRYRFRQNMKLQELENQRKIKEIEINNANRRVRQAEQQLRTFREKLIQNSLIIESLSDTEREASAFMQKLITTTILTEDDWEHFKSQFTMVFPFFIPALEQIYPNITQSDIRYLCLVKLDLNHKEIAAALGISPASLRVTWHRFKKRAGIANQEISSHEFVEELDFSGQGN
ncbi:tetratricopeptide repeat protein [Parapedobacter koreensis]|uniref:tetratricopeptide repeat protein n=1 Tax=Parapedobacter koreensis TaxID=332977 RepID=UPI00116002C8|nr:hypothetical protein [Parapedobacter koreensis]